MPPPYNDELPPPYTDRLPDRSLQDNLSEDDLPWNMSQDSLISIHAPKESVTQLRRYLIEIIAFTFDADFEQLNSALGHNTAIISRETTILREREKTELLRVSAIVKDLHQKLLYNRFNTTLKRDRDAVLEAIIKPLMGLKNLRFDSDYALDLISTYADHQCHPSKRKYTLISLQTPRFLRFIPSPSTGWLRSNLTSHAKFISAVSPNETVQVALGRALADHQDKLGLKEIPPEDYCLARKGFSDLRKTLQPLW